MELTKQEKNKNHIINFTNHCDWNNDVHRLQYIF